MTVHFDLRSHSHRELLEGEASVTVCVQAPDNCFEDVLVREHAAFHEEALDVLDIDVLVGPIVNLFEQSLGAVVEASDEVCFKLLLLPEEVELLLYD
jgi:hypothetical protein